ncbi:MAG: hypothetical protein AAF502_10945 [Bacteroidota bacterium]
MKKTNHWLLENHPIIWRSRILLTVWFSMIIFNLLLWFLGPRIIDIQLTNVPTAANLSLYVWVLRGFFFLVFAFLVYIFLHLPVYPNSLRNLLLAGVFSGLTLCIFVASSTVFTYPLITKIASVESDESFQKAYDFIAEHDFMSFEFMDTKFSKLSDSTKIKIADAAKRYGHGFIEYETNPSEKIISIGWGDDGRQAFVAHFFSIWDAKDYERGKGRYYTNYVIGLVITLLLCFLAGLALPFGINKVRYKEQSKFWKIALSRFTLIKPKFWRPAFLNRLNHYLSGNHPVIWNSKIIYYLFDTLFYFSLIPLLIVVLITKGNKEQFFRFFNMYDMEALLVFIPWIILLPVPWVIRQIRKGFRNHTFKEHVKHLFLSFLVLSLGYLPFIILTFFSFADSTPASERAQVFGSFSLITALFGYSIITTNKLLNFKQFILHLGIAISLLIVIFRVISSQDPLGYISLNSFGIVLLLYLILVITDFKIIPGLSKKGKFNIYSILLLLLPFAMFLPIPVFFSHSRLMTTTYFSWLTTYSESFIVLLWFAFSVLVYVGISHSVIQRMVDHKRYLE